MYRPEETYYEYVPDLGSSCMDCSKYDYGYCELYQLDITEPYQQKCEQYEDIDND